MIMKNICKVLILLLIIIPSVVFAKGLELEYIEPNYDTNQNTYVSSATDPYVFNFTFTPSSKNIGYDFKITNTLSETLYITDVDYSTSANYKISIIDLKKADIIEPGQSKIVTINIDNIEYPIEDNYSSNVVVYIKYDYAKNYIESTDEGTSKKGSNSISENPETGVFNELIIIGIPVIFVLVVILLYVKKKKTVFKTYGILLLLFSIGITIGKVNADKSTYELVINGKFNYKELTKVCVDESTDSSIKKCNGTPEDYDLYSVEIDPNGGKFNNSENKYKANYLKGDVVDLRSIDRLNYKLIDWDYNDSTHNFDADKLVVNQNSRLKANWEYGPYYWLTIDPNEGLYNESSDIKKIQLKQDEVYELSNPTRNRYTFYKWQEVGDTNYLIEDNKIKIGNENVYIKAKWQGIYDVIFDLNAEDATISVPKIEVSNLSKYGELPVPERSGYTFDGWYVDNELIDKDTIFDKDKDVTAVAHWLAEGDTKYKVRHLRTIIGKDSSIEDLNNYEVFDTETLSGETDSEVTPQTKVIEGFKSPDLQTVTIKGDESVVVDYYYQRNKYDLMLLMPDSGIKEIKYKVNGSDTWKTTTSTTTLKVDYDSAYKAYAIAEEGYYYYETDESHSFSGTMKLDTVIFSPVSYKCPKGYVCTNNAKDPIACETGTYQDEEGSTTCKTCPSGTYSSTTGSTTCTKCPPGSSCSQGSIEPTKCEVGKYQDEEGSNTCKICPSGTYSSILGSTSCIACDPGYESEQGSSTCTLSTYNVTFEPANAISNNYTTLGSSTIGIHYNQTSTNTIIPAPGYYITKIECTNNYTNTFTETYLDNNPTTTASTVTVKNPGEALGSTCTYSISNITASMITYSNSYTTCTNVQCAIDDLYTKVEAIQ